MQPQHGTRGRSHGILETPTVIGIICREECKDRKEWSDWEAPYVHPCLCRPERQQGSSFFFSSPDGPFYTLLVLKIGARHQRFPFKVPPRRKNPTCIFWKLRKPPNWHVESIFMSEVRDGGSAPSRQAFRHVWRSSRISLPPPGIRVADGLFAPSGAPRPFSRLFFPPSPRMTSQSSIVGFCSSGKPLRGHLLKPDWSPLAEMLPLPPSELQGAPEWE